MRVLGIDLGSREVKLVIMEDNKIVKKEKMSTVSFYRDYCDFDEKIVVNLEKLGIESKLDRLISTGYGRNNTDLTRFKAINEIKAHVYGGLFHTKLENFILLDIGGQDVKIVKVENKVITDLELNDKCAASCGRYLENMADVLEVDLNELSKHYKNPVTLNSTCAVFSESELIGEIAKGNHIEDLCAGVNYSLYKRLKPLLTKFLSKTLVLTGGVARNDAIRKYLSGDYKEIIKVNDPEFNGAIGCCYYGMKVGGK